MEHPPRVAAAAAVATAVAAAAADLVDVDLVSHPSGHIGREAHEAGDVFESAARIADTGTHASGHGGRGGDEVQGCVEL